MARSDAAAALLLLACLACGASLQAAEVGGEALEPVRLAVRQKQFSAALTRLEVLGRSGNEQAQYLLGAMLLANPAGDSDPEGARRWLQQAAASGSARAAYLLAVIAATAEVADDEAARRWLKEAADRGFEPAVALQSAGRLPLQFLPAEDLEESEARAAALLRAARMNDLATLQRLAGVTPATTVDAFGRGALALAAQADAAEAVAWLLQNGASIDARDSAGATALMLAARAPKARALEALLLAGASVSAADTVLNTALHLACFSADAARVQRLLQAGAAHTAINQDGDLPLDIALRGDHKEVEAALRAAGAQASRPPPARDEQLTHVQRARGSADAYAAFSDLAVAASRRDPGLLKTLLAAQSFSAAEKNAALMAAVESASTGSVTTLLQAGANAAAVDVRKRSPVGVAAQRQDAELLELLLRSGGSAAGKGNGGATLLLEAVNSGSSAIAQVLLAHGASIDAADDQGRTALMLAAARGDEPMLDMLLKLGASVALRDRSGRNALLHAAAGGTPAQVLRLLASGSDARLSDQVGNTPLAAAATRGMKEVLRALLAAGADVDAATRNGMTVLMAASAADQLEATTVLLGAGAKVNLRDRQGDTALTIAARDSSVALIRALLAAGADRNIRNGNRANAQDIAHDLHREAIVELLAGD
jgi:ankyrin repeat protein